MIFFFVFITNCIICLKIPVTLLAVGFLNHSETHPFVINFNWNIINMNIKSKVMEAIMVILFNIKVKIVI